MFLVVMDKPGARRMPRNFYYELGKVKRTHHITHVQKSVYEVAGETAAFVLINLGEKYGFQVRSYKVLEEVPDPCGFFPKVLGRESDV